jgi:ABC-2 type transport system permease protein
VRRTTTSVHALVWRQIRLSTLVLSALLVLIISVGLASFGASGGAKGMLSMRVLLTNPAITALYGHARSLPTAGSLVAWKMGMYLALAVAVWAALMATRVTRGGEDDGTWDLLVIGREGRQPALAMATLALGEGGLVLGLVTLLSLVIGGQSFVDSLLYATGLTGVAWSAAAIGVTASQLLAPRRSASQVALGTVIVLFVLRMIADASNANGWLRWTSPFGWLENTGAFQHRAAVWCVPLVLGPCVVAAFGWSLQRDRDIGSAWWTRADRSAPRTSLLRSTWGFAWRERRSTVFGWALGLGLWGLTVGYLTNALVVFCHSDHAFVKLLDHWGYGSMANGKGFIAEVCVLMSVAMGFFVVTLMTMVASDSLLGRLDLPFSFGTGRTEWLASTALVTVVSVIGVGLFCGLATWCGVVVSGTSMSVATPIEGMLNALSPMLLIAGASLLLVATLPRFAYVVMAALLGVSYLIAALGPTLNWPQPVLDSSVFHFVRLVPTEPTNWSATIVLCAVGLGLATVGYLRFLRADIGR